MISLLKIKRLAFASLFVYNKVSIIKQGGTLCVHQKLLSKSKRQLFTSRKLNVRLVIIALKTKLIQINQAIDRLQILKDGVNADSSDVEGVSSVGRLEGERLTSKLFQ